MKTPHKQGLTLQDHTCPICGREAKDLNKLGEMLCTMHGWIEALKQINFNQTANK